VAGARDGKVAGWVVYVLGASATAWSHGIGIYYAVILAGLGLVMRPETGRAWSRRSWVLANTVPSLSSSRHGAGRDLELARGSPRRLGPPDRPESARASRPSTSPVAPIGARGSCSALTWVSTSAPPSAPGSGSCRSSRCSLFALVLRQRDEARSRSLPRAAYLAPIACSPVSA
jgi:hypothetical protein